MACHSPLGRRFADDASRHPFRLIARTAARAALLKLCPLAHRPSDDLRDLDPLGNLLGVDVSATAMDGVGADAIVESQDSRDPSGEP